MAPICPGRNVAFCSELSPTILEDSGNGLLYARPIVTLSDSFNLCQAVKSDKGTGSDKRLRIVTAMLRQVFCGAQGATLAFVTTATMLADALTKALVHCPSLLAAMNARRHVFVTSDSSKGVKTTLSMPSEPTPTLKMAIGSESHSGRSGPCTRDDSWSPTTVLFLDTSDIEALFYVSGFKWPCLKNLWFGRSLNPLETRLNE